MSARLAPANTASKVSRDSSTVTAAVETHHDENQQSKGFALQQELYEDQEPPTLGALEASLPMDDQGEMTFMDNPPMVSPDFTQNWESWIGLDDPTGIFNSIEEVPFDGGGHVPHSEPSPLVHGQQQVSSNFAGENGTPDALAANQEATAEITHNKLLSRRESSAELSKAEKVRSHDMANEAGADVLDDVTRQLTSRLGRLQIAEDGQPRYYGATSNLHILHSGPQSLCQPNIRNVFTHGDAAIAQAGLQWQEDSSYENNLTNLFFSWHNALMYVVDREIFFRERTRCKSGQTSDLYSPALANAMCAILMEVSKRLELTHMLWQLYYWSCLRRSLTSRHSGCC